MKNISIRWKILGGIIAVNLLGAVVMMVFLHQAYVVDVEVVAERTVTLGKATLSHVIEHEDLDVYSPEEAEELLSAMKSVTGADYGLLVEKDSLDEDTYTDMLGERGLPNNWSERDTNVLVAVTGSEVADFMRLELAASSVPDIGRIVGVENGACSRMCHDSVGDDGAYWGVAWNDEGISRTHAVFPLTDAAGSPVALVYALDDITWDADHAKEMMMNTLWVFLATIAVAIVLIAGMIQTLVIKRLNRMTAGMEEISMRVAGGDYDAHYEPSGSKDEMGRFEYFFANFMDLMGTTLRTLVGKK